MSARRSTVSSRPTDIRMSPALTPVASCSSGVRLACVDVAGWHTRVSGPPSEVATRQSATRSRNLLGLLPTADVERQHRPVLEELTSGDVELGVLAQARIVRRTDHRMIGQHDGDRTSGLVLLSRSHRERAEPAERVERIERGRGGTVQHGVRPDLGQQIGLAGDDAERRVVVAGDALGRRMERDVHAVVERSLAQRRREGRIDHGEGSLDGSQCVEVGQLEARVRGGLGQHDHGPAGLHGLGERAGRGDVDERRFDPESCTRPLEECQRSGVELALGHDVAPGRTEGQHRRCDGTHSRRERQGFLGAFELGHRLLERSHRRIAVPAVEVAVAHRGGPAVRVVERVGFPRRRGPERRRERAPARRTPSGDRSGRRRGLWLRRLLGHGEQPYRGRRDRPTRS